MNKLRLLLPSEGALSEGALNLLKNNNIHVDALEVLNKNSIKNNEKIDSYYAEDLHNNKKSFKYIIKDFLNAYNAI